MLLFSCISYEKTKSASFLFASMSCVFWIRLKYLSKIGSDLTCWKCGLEEEPTRSSAVSLSHVQNTCEAVEFFIDNTLGFYLVNVTSAASLCSKTLCSSQGRCQRRNPASRAYLHLDPKAWKVTLEKGPAGGRRYKVLGQMSAQDEVFFKSEFRCQCYHGRAGKRCSKAVRG